jgi:hypothetical protein
VTSYCLWLGFDPFAFFLTFKNFLYRFEYQGVGPFCNPVGLRVVYRWKGDLHSLMEKILEHRVVKILGIIDCDMLWDTVTIDDVWTEEFFYGCEAYISHWLRLDPFHEVLDGHDGEGVIALCWG